MKKFMRLPVLCGIALLASGAGAGEVEKAAVPAEVSFAGSESVGSAVSVRVPAENSIVPEPW